MKKSFACIFLSQISLFAFLIFAFSGNFVLADVMWGLNFLFLGLHGIFENKDRDFNGLLVFVSLAYSILRLVNELPMTDSLSDIVSISLLYCYVQIFVVIFKDFFLGINKKIFG